ncbi:MAG: GNAT family N-acetyltransferase [Candidatus Heimdallarchaeota archaeon]
MTLQDDVLQYQSIATNNWPAKDLILMNGWILRVSEGITRRANSVLPLRYKGTNLDEDIDKVEKIYTDSKLPTVFQISDYYAPDNLHEKLLKRKYKTIAESFYLSIPFHRLRNITENPDVSYECHEEQSDEFFDAMRKTSNITTERFEGLKLIIDRILPPSRAFFLIRKRNNIVIGYALGVAEMRKVGIYNLYIHKDYRRMGLAQNLHLKMKEWGIRKGADGFHLCVQGDNAGAIDFYKKVGFKEMFKYRYLVKDL